MKKAVCAMAVITLMSQSALAGGMAEPLMEPEIIAQETAAGTGGGWVIPLILIAVIAAVASSTSGGETPVDMPMPQLQ